jgi:hypothetical protein
MSRTTGIDNRSAVIKLCLKSFFDYFDEHGDLTLPADWGKIMKEEGLGFRTKKSKVPS